MTEWRYVFGEDWQKKNLGVQRKPRSARGAAKSEKEVPGTRDWVRSKQLAKERMKND